MVENDSQLRQRKKGNDSAKASESVNKGDSKHNDSKHEKEKVSLNSKERLWDRRTLSGILFASILTRFFNLNSPGQVVFDEVHFGKFASFYIKGQYYFDLHPPLGKMILAAAGYLAGFDGNFKFDKIGLNYYEEGMYPAFVAMRGVCALFGVLIIVLGFKLLRELKVSRQSSLLACSFLIFDNALMCISRFILLDSILIFFIMFSAWSWVRFYKCRNKPFSLQWWTWLALCGTGLGCVTSVKMVGLFVISLVGLSTIHDLWRLLDYRRGISDAKFAMHFLARALCLIVLPIAIYLLGFYYHFVLLDGTGPGDNFMSTRFQATLKGNSLTEIPFTIHYNTNVTIKNNAESHMFLHSHLDKYPLHLENKVTSNGNQVTCYSHSDLNNIWHLIAVNKTSQGDGKYAFLKDGDLVQLKHVLTNAYLITHDVASPLTMTNMEVTTWPEEKLPDREQETWWRIEIEEGALNSTFVETKRTVFKLINHVHKVYLNNHLKNLPKWGFEQREVNGLKNTAIGKGGFKWIFDSITPTIDDESYRNSTEYKSSNSVLQLSFWKKFSELQATMIRHNANLMDDHPFASSPYSWPFVIRGVSFWQNKESKAQIYFMGNPIVWYAGVVAIYLYLSIVVIDLIALRRGFDFFHPEVEEEIKSSKGPLGLSFNPTRYQLLMSGGYLAGAYALHYIPFFIMGRVLFLHHYLPSVVFGSLLFGLLMDIFLGSGLSRRKTIIMVVLLAAVVASFSFFLPFTLGWPLDKESINRRKLLKTWDFGFA